MQKVLNVVKDPVSRRRLQRAAVGCRGESRDQAAARPSRRATWGKESPGVGKGQPTGRVALPGRVRD